MVLGSTGAFEKSHTGSASSRLRCHTRAGDFVMRLGMILGALLLVVFAADTAIAACYEYGTKRVSLPAPYSKEINELVNDAARIHGHAMLGHHEFHYAGDAKTLNKLIA